ncbi:MAG: tyrosine-type recombinase/integrase [Nitrospirae bacterium]|nr:tyrosine-type recombinase/integrase [Nitrospirota bacterium]
MAYEGAHASGWRVKYKVYLPDKTIEKEKYRKTKENAHHLYREAARLETLAAQGSHKDEDVLRALKSGVIVGEEAQRLLKKTILSYPTLNKLFPLFDNYAKKHWNNTTYQTYITTIRRILRDIGDVAITGIEEYKNLIKDYVERVAAEKGHANRTKNKYLSLIRQIIDIAIKEKKFPFDQNPVALIEKYPDVVVRFPRTLSYDEVKSLLEEAKKRTGLFGLFYEITITFLFCGLRLTELKYLTHDDVLNDRVKIQPKEILTDETEEKLKNNLWIPKTNSARVIYIDDDIWQEKIIQKLRKMPKKSRYLFSVSKPSMNMLTFDSAYNDRLFRKTDLTLHCLRHTFITWRIECGDPLPRVMRLAGHSNIETTMRYTHISEEKMKDILPLL